MKKTTCLNCGTTFEIGLKHICKDELGWYVRAGCCPGCDGSFDIDLKDVLEMHESNPDTIIEALYNGRIYPAEDCVPQTEKYWCASNDHANSVAALRNCLDAEQQPLLDLITESHHTVIDEMGLAFLRMGLRLGAQLTLALFRNDTQEQAPDAEA